MIVKHLRLIGPLLLLLISCATPKNRPLLEFTQLPYDSVKHSDFKRQKANFASMKQTGKFANVEIDGLPTILDAMHYQQLKQFDKSISLWKKALVESEDLLTEFVFERLVKDLNQFYGNKYELSSISQYLKSDTSLGESDWMKQKMDDQDKSFETKVAKILGIQLEDIDILKDKARNEVHWGSLGKIYCFSKQFYDWRTHYERLAADPGLEFYWQGIVFACQKKYSLSVTMLERSMVRLLENSKSYGAYILHGYRSLLEGYRFLGDREAISRTYLRVSAFVSDFEGSASELGYENQFDRQYHQVNYQIWSGRYEALIGQYESAKTQINGALITIKKLVPKIDSSLQARKLRELEAEAYHVLSWRIAVEQKEYSEAETYAISGLSIPSLPDDWINRFLWMKGWYQYLNGNIQLAFATWSNDRLLSPNHRSRVRVIFWLAYLSKKLDKSREHDKFKELLFTEHGESFYATYARGQLQWKFRRALWDDVNPSMLRSWDLDKTKIDQNPLWSRLYQKSLLLLELENKPLAEVYLHELSGLIARSGTAFYEAQMIVSRLLLVNSSYSGSLMASSRARQVNRKLLEDYPEQIFLYYPFAFHKEVALGAEESGVDDTMILSIMRQESGFRSKATSWVGAKGLMQLMPATATKYGLTGSNEMEKIQNLEDPKTNLSIAASYLKALRIRYQGNMVSIAAAYNAGEYVVDRWLKHRRVGSQIEWIETIPFSETQKYVKLVLRNYIIYSELYKNEAHEEILLLPQSS